MKKDKNMLYYSRILEYLLEGHIYSISQLVSRLGLSEKTVRTKINQLNVCLDRSNAGIIKKKQGTGVWLEASEEQKINIKLIMDSVEIEAVSDLEVRNRQLIGNLLLLKPGENTTLSQIAESLYLSPPTVSGMMKTVQPWFEKRGLTIRSVRKKGIYVTGEEYSYRIAIKDYLLYMMPEVTETLLEDFAVGIDIFRIRRIIVDAENAWNIELEDESFHMVWILTCLSLTRNQTEHRHWFEENQNIQYYVEYSFAKFIYKRISMDFQIELPGNDVVLLAVFLIMNTILDIDRENYTRQYDEKLQNFVKNIIETIDSVLDAGLKQDSVLFENLLIHMRSAIFRMKYSTFTPESINKYVKNKYKQTFFATWSASYLFEEQYGIQLPEDELAEITLYIQAALIRHKKEKPLSAVLVTKKGLASSQLMMEIIKYNLHEIKNIKIISNHDFSIHQWPEADLIISMSNLHFADSRIVGIGDRISEHEIKILREKVWEIKRVRNKQCFFG